MSRELKYMFYSPNWGMSNKMNFTDFDKLKHNWDESVEVMEYTGKEDVNCNEIYTGHIVKVNWNNGTEDLETIAEVRYSPQSVGFVLDDKKRYDFNFLSHLRIEIIGNIFLNRDLLPNERR